jgi:hypothetical protein
MERQVALLKLAARVVTFLISLSFFPLRSNWNVSDESNSCVIMLNYMPHLAPSERSPFKIIVLLADLWFISRFNPYTWVMRILLNRNWLTWLNFVTFKFRQKLQGSREVRVYNQLASLTIKLFFYSFRNSWECLNWNFYITREGKLS